MSTDNTVPSAARTIKASEFKAKCLKLMDEVAENGEEIVITKNGARRPGWLLIGKSPRPGSARTGTNWRSLGTSSPR